MTTQKTIDIAADFSRYPGGRYRLDGEWSGERFRDDLLHPALAEFDKVVVLLDGTLGYGSGFLEEAFGGLVRIHGWTGMQLLSRLYFNHSEVAQTNRIWRFIVEADSAFRSKIRPNIVTDPPYPGTECRACQHYNRAVLDGGAIDVSKEAEMLHLWLKCSVTIHGPNGDDIIKFAVGSPAHYSLCRLIEGIRQQEGAKS